MSSGEPAECRLPLQQERLWFLHRLDPGDASYNLPVTLLIRGTLDTEALERALMELVDRHDTLRTRFGERDGTPVQTPGGRLPELEFADRTGDGERARELIAERGGRPFDLERGPVLRLTLVKIGPREHLLGLVFHHIAADGWSIEIVLRELSELYEAYTAGKPSPLPPLSMSYADHVRAQGEQPGDERALAYWRETLAGAPVLELPTDRPRRPVRSGRGDQVVFQIPAGLLAELETLARAERCTLFMVMLAAFQILLARHSGQDDVCVGVPTGGRKQEETEQLVGHFAGTVVLRGDLSADPAFRDFLLATRKSALRAFTHQDVPLERILSASHAERDRSRTPLFQAMFMLLRRQNDRPRLGDLEVEVFDQGFTQARTDVALDVFQGPAGAGAVFTYDADLFDSESAERMIRRFLTLLADVAARPGARLGELELLPAEERAELLTRWNSPAAARSAGTTPELFAAQLGRTPHAVAVTWEGRDLTFAQLDARAERISRLLRGRGGLVAVCLRRSPDMVAALLAVWKAGAAYLPLDPEYPRERIALILEDSGAAVVLTEPALADRFDEGRTVLVDSDTAPVAAAAPPAPKDLAYVLYTSGSTGRPKGVAVPHRALARFLLAMGSILGDQAGRSWLALTSLSFDISALEIFLPLVSGGRTVIASEPTMRDGVALTRLIRSQGVTNVQATPSGWRMLLEAGFTDPSIHALVGGEALPPQLAADLRARVARLVNMYGPTETTIWSSYWEVPERPRTVSIGGPIDGTRLHVLDDGLRLVPVGVPGELCIAGEGVASGYLGRPDLTAERFLPDPYGPAGTRLYRTGDRVRRLADGTIEFLGRTDNQVKLRGHRIELGEIEAVLDLHYQVAGAAVVIRDEVLVAFVVAREPSAGLVAELLDHAASVLPSQLVPGAVVVLDALPLTPNGKVDRRALPAAPVAVAASRTPPRTPEERRVAEVFAEVLGVAGVGAEDDFFLLGGHSLRAAKVVARLGGMSVGDLFAHPTVAALAARLTEGAGPAPIPPRREGADLPLSAAQERLWFLHRLDPQDASYNMYLVRRLRGSLDLDTLTRAFSQLVARHETLRTRYEDREGRPFAVLEPVTEARLELLDLTPEQAERAVAERTNAPFDLAAGPPMRVSLIRVGPDDHVLCVVLHHIAGDGWSLNVIQDDLATFYQGLVPAPLAVQFGDIARWQRDQGEPHAALEYWRDRLSGLPALELPLDRQRGPDTGRRGAFHGLSLNAERAARLEEVAREQGGTLFMVLVAAYQILLSRHTGQRDFAIGSTAAGRDRVEVEQVVGYLAGTLVLRADLSGDPPFDALLRRTRDTVLDALTGPEIPFELLLTELGIERDSSGDALFQTMLMLHSQDTEGGSRTSFGDLDLALFAGGYAQAKFDLTVEAWRGEADLQIVFGYDAEVLDEDTIADLAGRFDVLLAGIEADPGVPVSALPVLTADDEALLLERAHGPAQASRATVPGMIAEAARRTPEAVAVECGGTRLTYAELTGRAARLAAGLGGHDLVGVCLGRSADLIVALLAVWHAGAAYLPLDAGHPAERLALLLADAGVTAVLTDDEHAVRLPPTVQAIPVDSTGAPAPGVEGTGAYVIYTSGSTGTPKGVVVEHESLAARVSWMRDAYGLGPGDRVVQFASVSFDTHAEEIFPALAAGARVVMLPDGGASLPDLLASPAGRDVTVLDLPTAYWHHLVAAIDEIAWPDDLRLVILGGEQAQATAVTRWRARFGDRIPLVNTYGPTETTIIATAAVLTGEGGSPPIGRPISETSVHVLDAGALVPPGGAGELAIGGAGVARGYLGRSELTAERFVHLGGQRVYLTGDRVRWRRDGQLEFLGRLDDQVKVRGFRIEPGEVEACLLTCLGVSQAAVVATGDTLVAYTVGEATPDALRRHAALRLPPHLVPSTFVGLDRLPLTTSGKLDRAALTRVIPDAPAASQDQPMSEAEQVVAEIWAEVLGLDRVGVTDDFFHLGGHSLIALQVIARVRATVELQVPIRTLFRHRTVAEFAAAVEDLLSAELAELSEEEAERLLAATIERMP